LEKLKFFTYQDSIISTSCCSALDHIITSLFKQLTKKKRQMSSGAVDETQSSTPVQVYQQQPQVFQQILTTLLNIITFEECRNQWSMSRPLLGLVLLNEQV
jgi:exportin-7